MSPSKRLQNAHKLGTHPLYTKPCRGGSAWISALLICNNLAACAFCWTWLAYAWSDAWYYSYWGTARQNTTAAFDIAILLGLLVVSIVDGVHRYKRSISSRRIVITACISIIALAAWAILLTCIPDGYQFYFGPIVFGPSGFVFNSLYLLFGAMALHREKKGWRGASKGFAEVVSEHRVGVLSENDDDDDRPVELGSYYGYQHQQKKSMHVRAPSYAGSSIANIESQTATMTTMTTRPPRDEYEFASPSTTMTTTRPPSYWSHVRANETIVEDGLVAVGKS